MAADDHTIARQAFSTPEWRSAADSLFQATGATVNVMDLGSCEPHAGAPRCGHCHLVTDIPGALSCFDTPPKSDSGSARVVCRAGLPTLVSPVLRKGRPIAQVVLGGFVTSTRDRRRLWELLAAKGMRDDSVHMAVKSIPVVSRAEAEGYLHVALACARTVLDATAERLSAAERFEELRLFVTAGQQVVATESLDAATLGGIAEEAVSLVGGEAGAVLRPTGGFLEVVARTQRWRGAVGATFPCDESAAGRAASSRRTVVARSKHSGATGTLALPLVVGERLLGVLEVRIPAAALPVEPERVARLDRFGRFIAIALEREDERTQVERAMAGYGKLNELAAALGGASDADRVTAIVTRVLAETFDCSLSGVVLSSGGRDGVKVTVAGDVSQCEVDYVLGEVTGRDASTLPTALSHAGPDRGGVLVVGDVRSQWALLSVKLEHADSSIGHLFVARADGGRYKPADRALLQGIAGHAAAALGRVVLFTRIRDDYAKTIAALSATLDAGEHMPSGHSSRVMEYSMMVGEELGLPFEDVEQLRFAGLLHDIGKTGLPSELLLKPSELSAEEFERVRAHSQVGANIVAQIEFLKSLTPIILHHHERWDGSGYPSGLHAEEIPIAARILAVADAFDAMTTERAYRERLSLPEAREEMLAEAGVQFDPAVVAALFAALDGRGSAASNGPLASAKHNGRLAQPA